MKTGTARAFSSDVDKGVVANAGKQSHRFSLINEMASLSLATTVFFISILVGCSHAPPRVPRKPTLLKPSAVWADQGRRSRLFKYLSGKLSLRLQGKEHNISGKGQLLAQLPDKLRLELRDPLGRVQYILVGDGENVVAYYPRQKEAYVEAHSGRNYILRFMGLDFSLEEMEHLFLGILPKRFVPTQFESWEWDTDREEYRGKFDLEKKGSKFPVVLYVDPDQGVLTKIELPESHGIARVTYSEFDSCCGDGNKKETSIPPVRLAHVVTVHLDSPESKVELQWNKIKRMKKSSPPNLFHLELPEDAKKIPLE